ncbi:longitudinals lacking protein, isoforms H/M/V-like isoform X3 [Schistocerca nitens]|uniref:longitudinals lacking protein, isoforms H/M/V-like isoform X3 n=1 Tax=Schistocerca nitens TaxID=7011 RepID=UPI002117B4FE|nr:longitudinals lacking protein, isoforms H/M/V-like isoform X3 [Schistocerca nitens]
MAGSDAEQFSLRWNNFHSNLVSGFHALLQEVELVDVTLAAEGQFIQAHKIVLSVCSPYFKQLFQVNPCKHPIVILKDVGHKELIAILQFMYQGEVNVRQEELADFLKTAELLQIKGLTGNDNNREPDRTPCTTPRPSPHRQPGSHIRVSDVRSEAHLSEVSQGYPSGNDANIDLASAVSEESASPARPTKRLHSDASVSSSTLSHRKEQKEEEFVQKIPKVEPIDLDLDAEITSDQISPEGLQQFLTNSGKSTHPQQNISAGGNGNSTPAIAQSQLIHPSSISRHGQVSETSVVSVQSASQDNPAMFAWKPMRRQDFRCPLCEKKFVNKSNLNIHVRDKHGEGSGPQVCFICFKQVKNQSCLRVHMYYKHRSNLSPSSLPHNESKI